MCPETQYALTHFRKPLHTTDKEDWCSFNKDTDGIMPDDLDFKNWPPYIPETPGYGEPGNSKRQVRKRKHPGRSTAYRTAKHEDLLCPLNN